jgi:hypothetical protein
MILARFGMSWYRFSYRLFLLCISCLYLDIEPDKSKELEKHRLPRNLLEGGRWHVLDTKPGANCNDALTSEIISKFSQSFLKTGIIENDTWGKRDGGSIQRPTILVGILAISKE